MSMVLDIQFLLLFSIVRPKRVKELIDMNVPSEMALSKLKSFLKVLDGWNMKTL